MITDNKLWGLWLIFGYIQVHISLPRRVWPQRRSGSNDNEIIKDSWLGAVDWKEPKGSEFSYHSSGRREVTLETAIIGKEYWVILNAGSVEKRKITEHTVPMCNKFRVSNGGLSTFTGAVLMIMWLK